MKGTPGLQRRYTKFPGGLHGLGLLFLRTAVGARLIIEGSACLLTSQSLNSGTWVLGLIVFGAGLSFVLGFLTPLAAGLSATAATAVWYWHPAWASCFAGLLGFNTIVVTTALILLGPGAFSLDAYFFGRRRIVIPRVAHS